MSDWRELLDTSAVTIDDIKRRLPLEWVIIEAGVVLERHDDRLVGPCPFHLDSNPSFAVFGDELDRCGCWSCDFSNGDVLDFIQRWKALEFRDALREAIRLLRQFETVNGSWTPAPPPNRQPVDPEVLKQRARDAYVLGDVQVGLGAISNFLYTKEIPIAGRWLHEHWFVGVVDSDTILVPHLVDEDGTLVVTGYKTRTARSHLYAATGSRFMDLYGGWRDQGRNEIILCEGESDAWRLSHAFPDHDVVALPAGANQVPKPEWVDRFRKRNVTILMDADAPGRSAARRWHEALAPVARTVRIATLEDGADACSTQLNIGQVIREAKAVPAMSGTVTLRPDGAAYLNVDGQSISNFALRPTRLIEMEDDEGGSAIEGYLHDDPHRPVFLTVDDISSEHRLRTWSLSHDRSWRGSLKQTQALWELLLYEGMFLPRGRGTRVAGWHEDHFVLPGRTIGPRHWVYLPPPNDADVSFLIGRPRPRSEGGRALLAGLYMHAPSVVTPIMGWLAAAPIRSLFPAFPVLAVVGASGAGKNTLLRELLRLLGWGGEPLVLGPSTVYGVESTIASSNGVPVWIDEYGRINGRKETRLSFDQSLRNAWEALASARGGSDSTNLSRVRRFKVSAPIIVSGEGDFRDQSLVERMVKVPMQRADQVEGALTWLLEHPTNVGEAYLHWLVDLANEGLPPIALPNADRPLQSRYVIEYGWSLLERFAAEVLHVNSADWPDLDMTVVETEQVEALDANPYLEALQWALEWSEGPRGILDKLAWAHSNEVDLWVKVRPTIDMIVKERIGVDLPSDSDKAMHRFLKERFPGTGRSTTTGFGRAVRVRGALPVIRNLDMEPNNEVEFPEGTTF